MLNRIFQGKSNSHIMHNFFFPQKINGNSSLLLRLLYTTHTPGLKRTGNLDYVVSVGWTGK